MTDTEATEKQCEIAIAQINGLLQRRQSITTTYLTVCTALSGGVALLFKDGHLQGMAQTVSVVFLLAAGIAATELWRRLILQYRALLNWWYSRLREIEPHPVECVGLFTREYSELYSEGNSEAVIGLTRYEVTLTWLFTTMYLVFIIGLTVLLILDRSPVVKPLPTPPKIQKVTAPIAPKRQKHNPL
jgi:hypothetical protein